MQLFHRTSPWGPTASVWPPKGLSLASVVIGDNGSCHTILETTWQAEQMCLSVFLNWVGIPQVTLGNYLGCPEVHLW